VITQRLILVNGLWACPGCPAVLTDGKLAHPDSCPELGQHIARAAEAIARRPYPPLPKPRTGKERAS
jgi:hypothetical protein